MRGLFHLTLVTIRLEQESHGEIEKFRYQVQGLLSSKSPFHLNTIIQATSANLLSEYRNICPASLGVARMKQCTCSVFRPGDTIVDEDKSKCKAQHQNVRGKSSCIDHASTRITPTTRRGYEVSQEK